MLVEEAITLVVKGIADDRIARPQKGKRQWRDVCTGHRVQRPCNRRRKTMRIGFKFVVLAGAILAAPAFAQDEAPAGEWDGVLVRNGVETPIAMRLAESDDMWRGRLRIDDASSPLESVRVTENSVHFKVPGEGAFDGTFSNGSMTGSVSGSASAGSFALTLQEPPQQADVGYADPIESQGP
jgi:hypothetical protein